MSITSAQKRNKRHYNNRHQQRIDYIFNDLFNQLTKEMLYDNYFSCYKGYMIQKIINCNQHCQHLLLVERPANGRGAVGFWLDQKLIRYTY